MRIVLDTNILVRANPKALPQGLARELLLTIVSGPHTLLLSPPILAEVQRVLTYPHVQARWPLTEDAVGKPRRLNQSTPDRVPSRNYESATCNRKQYNDDGLHGSHIERLI